MFEFLKLEDAVIISKKDLRTILVTEGLMDKDAKLEDVIDLPESLIKDMAIVTKELLDGKLKDLRKSFGVEAKKATLKDISDAIDKEIATADEPIENVTLMIEDSNGSSSFVVTKDMIKVFSRPGENEVVALLTAYEKFND